MKKTRIYNSMLLTLVISLSLIGCAGSKQTKDIETSTNETEEVNRMEETDANVAEKGAEVNSYIMISMDDAKELFKEAGDYIILDVRTAAEFADGHIPGAVNIANEDIGDKEIPALPVKDQLIYVYCRSGNRSKQAAQKLVDLGYSNIVEFGGIIDWTGEIEK